MFKIVITTVLSTVIMMFSAATSIAQARVCVLLDHSASMIHYAVDLPTLAELHGLHDLIIRESGLVGYGIIQSNPSTALLRSPIISAPEAGLKEPERSTTNIFDRARLQKEYERNLPDHREREKARIDSAAEAFKEFEERLKPFIETGAGIAQSSDLWGNVRRCETMLMEPVPPGYPEPDRYMLLVSDGRHNLEDSKFDPVDKSITVLSVSGAQGLGDTSQIGRHVLWFESSGGAINYLTAVAGGR